MFTLICSIYINHFYINKVQIKIILKCDFTRHLTASLIIRVGLGVFELDGFTTLTCQGLNDGYFFVGVKTRHYFHFLFYVLCCIRVLYKHTHNHKNISLIIHQLNFLHGVSNSMCVHLFLWV